MQGYLKVRSSKLPWWASRYCELEEDGMLPALLTANSHPVNSFNFNSDIGSTSVQQHATSWGVTVTAREMPPNAAPYLYAYR
jgi:hypothetical protein